MRRAAHEYSHCALKYIHPNKLNAVGRHFRKSHGIIVVDGCPKVGITHRKRRRKMSE